MKKRIKDLDVTFERCRVILQYVSNDAGPMPNLVLFTCYRYILLYGMLRELCNRFRLIKGLKTSIELWKTHEELGELFKRYDIFQE